MNIILNGIIMNNIWTEWQGGIPTLRAGWTMWPLKCFPTDPYPSKEGWHIFRAGLGGPSWWPSWGPLGSKQMEREEALTQRIPWFFNMSSLLPALGEIVGCIVLSLSKWEISCLKLVGHPLDVAVSLHWPAHPAILLFLCWNTASPPSWKMFSNF